MSRRKSANKGNGKHRQNRQARVRPQPSSRATYADLLAIGVVFVEWDELMREGLPLLAAHPLVFFGQAALGFAVNLLTILVVKFTSSISFKLISMAKNAGIVLLSVPLFHNPISPTQALGYSITMMGFGWYNYVKMNTIKITGL